LSKGGDQMEKTSKMIMFHHMALLQQLMEFSQKVLKNELSLSLKPDFSGYVSGSQGIESEFTDIPGAVSIVKDSIKACLATQINQFNQELKNCIESAEQLNKDRAVWKEVAENVLAGKWNNPETELVHYGGSIPTEHSLLTKTEQARTEQLKKAAQNIKTPPQGPPNKALTWREANKYAKKLNKQFSVSK